MCAPKKAGESLMSVRSSLSLFVLAALLAACSSKSPEPSAAAAAPAAAAHADGIAWHQGDVDSAFAAAKASGKPVFLYWGAVWCPPCQQVKATIFAKREFIERTRQLVPVYLDGDEPAAQLAAERFGVVGYPTMILLRPDGTEVTRLPGGTDVDLYTSVVDSALASLKPVKDLIDVANRDPAGLTENDWKLLAYYAWDVDFDRIAPAAEAPKIVAGLVQKCPKSFETDCVRLKLTLAALVADEKDKPSVTIDRRDLLATLNAVLDRPELQKLNLDYLIYESPELVGAATVKGSAERAALVTRWQALLDALANDESLARVDRMGMGYARVLLARLDTPKGPLPADVLAIARDRAAWADRATTDPYERQAVINRAAATLDEAGLETEANDLLTRELKVSKSPYYFMLDIADLAQRAGHKDVALHWLERAYHESEGPATRFQWGTDYLLGLIEMAPEDDQRIQTVGLAVIDELGKGKDNIHQRSSIRLGRLDKALMDWNKGDNHRPVVRALRARLQEICAPIGAGDSARKTCDDFLAKA